MNYDLSQGFENTPESMMHAIVVCWFSVYLKMLCKLSKKRQKKKI